MSEQLFRYAACGGGNLVLDWVLYFLIYNFVIGHELVYISLPFREGMGVGPPHRYPLYRLSDHVVNGFLASEICDLHWI